MKKQWSMNEVQGMRDRWLHFADYDKKLILEGFGIAEASQVRDTENPPHKASVSPRRHPRGYAIKTKRFALRQRNRSSGWRLPQSRGSTGSPASPVTIRIFH